MEEHHVNLLFILEVACISTASLQNGRQVYCTLVTVRNVEHENQGSGTQSQCRFVTVDGFAQTQSLTLLPL